MTVTKRLRKMSGQNGSGCVDFLSRACACCVDIDPGRIVQADERPRVSAVPEGPIGLVAFMHHAFGVEAGPARKRLSARD